MFEEYTLVSVADLFCPKLLKQFLIYYQLEHYLILQLNMIINTMLLLLVVNVVEK